MKEQTSGPERRVLVTGAAGFIGSHVAHRLLDMGADVLGLDSLNNYYDLQLKQDRLARLTAREGFRFAHLDLADREGMARLFKAEPFDEVVHLAAQAGVRYSVDHPMAYVDSNMAGMMTLLEGCRHQGVKHLVYASSSSVYGASNTMPLSEDKVTDRPVSLYAASKKANELMVHSYSHLFGIPSSGLRLFTVYGPWGRPDMAIFKFVRAILAGESIQVYNHGQMRRDFTYVDDVVDAVVRVLSRPPVASGKEPAHRVLNVGNSSPVMLMRFVECIEAALGTEAIKEMLPMQQGDVPETWADVTALKALIGDVPGTPIEEGVKRFVEWYRTYYPRTGSPGE
ncbi:NAD-dependent epimerase/dehydratase family protein [Hydrogenophaga sp. 5NK40-0174]|uniref:NAD-dependent epimerase/dehydratase family protein n=1 Tax=Hydrogenophaga sp. 5NK40-0174 TaxID=3127649 RepID=UPI0031025D90